MSDMTSHAEPPSADETPKWTVEAFARFWSKPDARLVSAVLTEDVVGFWPGLDRPVRGRDDYVTCIDKLVTALPGLRLEVAEHASHGDVTFVRWIMRATGAEGPFELSGIDRVRQRDGLVAENIIVFDTAAFVAKAGQPPPWVR
jgi:hypothetical protein